MSAYASVEELLASPEYQALGVIAKDQMLREHFPDVDDQVMRSGARVMESAKLGRRFGSSSSPQSAPVRRAVATPTTPAKGGTMETEGGGSTRSGSPTSSATSRPATLSTGEVVETPEEARQIREQRFPHGDPRKKPKPKRK
jgi:hypothetical protein